MTRTAAATGFAVKVLIEKDEIAPVRVVRVLRNVAMTRPRALFIGHKNASQAAREFPRYFLKGSHISGASRALDFERFTIEEVITLERFDDQEINWKPNRPAPVGVATK